MRSVLYIVCLAVICTGVSYSEINIEGKLTHEFSAGPGSSYSGSIIIRNSGDKTEEVKIYQKDYSSVAGGIHNYQEPGTNERSNASWISLAPKKFFIRPGESYTAYFKVEIPDDETLSGTYWSMLMAEAIPAGSPESSNYNPDTGGIGVQTVLRYGIRVISHIEDTGTIAPEIISANLEQEEGSILLVLDIKNNGTRLIRVNTWAELYKNSGEFAGKFSGDHLAVFPGSSIRFKVGLSDVNPDDYQALIVLDCGGDNVFGINYNLVIK